MGRFVQTRTVLPAALALLLASYAGFGPLSPASAAQETEAATTVLDGVYSSTQANRGRIAYEESCAECHGLDLLGGPEPPPLRGPGFLNRWREDTLDGLFLYTRNRMPPQARSSLEEESYVDIVVYLLRRNGFPIGTSELRADQLHQTLLVGLAGPQPLPNNTIIHTVGCLTEGADGWMLVQARPATRARHEAARPADYSGPGVALGEESYALQNYQQVFPRFVPEDHRDHKLEIEGVLFSGGRISLTAVDILATSCVEE